MNPIQLTVHQLVVGMKIYHPLKPDTVITIKELFAYHDDDKNIGLHYEEYGEDACFFSVDTVFNLAEPFDLSLIDVDWIEKSIEEEIEYMEWMTYMDEHFDALIHQYGNVIAPSVEPQVKRTIDD